MLDLEDTWWQQAILIIVINLLFSFIILKFSVIRQDGKQRIGWTASKVVMNQKEREVFMPVYIDVQDYNELNSPNGDTK